MNIENIFDEIYGEPTELSEETIVRFQQEWNLPLSESELSDLKKKDTKPSYWNDTTYGNWKPKNFENWSFPQGNFPETFIALIRRYSGCEFMKGDREFSIFGPDELREMNIAYKLPEYLKGGVSVGLDGAGNHIIIDMRSEAHPSHLKIYGVQSGYLDWEGAKLIAHNFEEFIQGIENIDELVNG